MQLLCPRYKYYDCFRVWCVCVCMWGGGGGGFRVRVNVSMYHIQVP